MRRPIAIYPLMIWTYIEGSHVMNLALRALAGTAKAAHSQALIAPGLFLIAVLIGIFQLRHWARIAMIIILGAGAVLCQRLIWGAITSPAPTPSRFYFTMALFILIDCVGIIYVVRPRFAQACTQYRESVEQSRKDRTRDAMAKDLCNKQFKI